MDIEDILFEDNHIIIVNKRPGELVQGDKSGDVPLVELLKAYIKERDGKPGNVFIGLPHRLDRPVSGVVVFAKTSKALSRLCDMFAKGDVHKTYWAIVRNVPANKEGVLTDMIKSVEKNNKSYVVAPGTEGAKAARLAYKVIAQSDRYALVEVRLFTGRKHQIRVQLSHIGSPIKGDLKYGDRRSNPDGSISLHARNIRFIHPVSGKEIDITAPVPDDTLWHVLEKETYKEQ